MDEGGPRGVLECACMCGCFLKGGTVQDDSGTVSLCRDHFYQWCLFGHYNGGGNAKGLSGNGDGLSMVAHRSCDYPVPAFLCAELSDLIGSSTYFERSRALQILSFEMHVGSRHETKCARMEHG